MLDCTVVVFVCLLLLCSGEDHKFGIMLGLIVTVGMMVIIGVTLFARFCADDSRRRARMRRQWQAGVDIPPPPQFHLISPRIRRRMRRWMRRLRRRRRQQQLSLASASDADEPVVQEEGAESSSTSGSDADSDLFDSDNETVELDGNTAHLRRLRRHLGARADAVVPPVYSEIRSPGPHGVVSLAGRRIAGHRQTEQETSFTNTESNALSQQAGDACVATGSDGVATDQEEDEHQSLLPRCHASPKFSARASVSSLEDATTSPSRSRSGSDVTVDSLRGSIPQDVEQVQRMLRSSTHISVASEAAQRKTRTSEDAEKT